MEQMKNHTSRLFLITAVENRDDIDEKFERSYKYVQTITAGLGDKDTHDALNTALLKDKGYEDVTIGLMVTILSDPNIAAKSLRDLTLINRDGFLLLLNHLSQIVLERYTRLNDLAKSQLLWLLRELIRSAVNNVDNLCWNILRHAAGGDVSPKNLFLVDSLLDIFIEHRSWLDKFPVLIASVVYTYLRLMEDHNAPSLADLRKKEVGFLIKILREKFSDCLAIGRDLVRLLQNVARIPEFELLWKDILTNPKGLSASFSGVLQLLQMRTSRRFLQSRLTPEMERKLVFLTSQVRFGQHKRYQDWFQRQYLATAESQSLRCDMIRFIVGVIHPTNELLSSDIIPRWAVIGWLLTTCTSSVAVSNAKLALFYDWLFFESDKDNIMNIEPAILVMHHSMRSHPAVSATLLDFLCRIIGNFHPPLMEKVRSGIHSSLRQILDKRVLPSLLPLFDNAKLDRDLKTLIRETFREFCVPQTHNSNLDPSSVKMDDYSNNHVAINKSDIDDFNPSPQKYLLTDEPTFSDEDDEETSALIIQTNEEDTDDDDIPLARVRLKKTSRSSNDDVSVLDGPIRLSLTKLQNENDQEKRCQLMDCIVNHIQDLDDEGDVISTLSKLLCSILDADFKAQIFPKILNNDALIQSIKSPLFVLFKSVYNLANVSTKSADNSGKQMLLKVLAEMYSLQPNVGYLLLYFLKVQRRTDRSLQPLNNEKDSAKNSNYKIGLYKEFCQYVEKKVDNCLYDDLTACHLNETALMMWLVPDLYRDFKQQTVNNAQILRVILSAIDALQLQELIGKVMQSKLTLFRHDNLQTLLKTSLAWESIEQLFLWQLVRAHDIPVENIVPLVSHLDYRQHAEALTAITLLLKREQPTNEMVRYLFSRDVREVGDPLVVTLVKYWFGSDREKMAELVAGLLSTRYPATSPNKRKRTTANSTATAMISISSTSKPSSLNSAVPSADQVLGHLDNIRRYQEECDTNSPRHNHSGAASSQDGNAALSNTDANHYNSSSNHHGSSRLNNCHYNNVWFGDTLYHTEAMRKALQQAHNSGTDGQRRQYGALFALAMDGVHSSLVDQDDSDTVGSNSNTSTNSTSTKGGGKGTGRGRKPGPKSQASSKRNAKSDSSDDSSEEEEIVKPKQPKKRKKVMSDSD